MKYITQIREHKLPFMGNTLYNYFYTCPECNSESNAMGWFISIKPDAFTMYQCPHCNVKCLKGEEV